MARLVQHHTRWSGLEREDLDAEIAVLGIAKDKNL